MEQQRGAIQIGAFNDACGYLEMCITNMHRVTVSMKRLKSSPEIPKDLKDKLPLKPTFLRSAKRIEKMRALVHHTLDRIAKGEIAENTPFAIMPTGPERTENGQFIKIIDRVKVGNEEIRFYELSSWLKEMAACAEVIAAHSIKELPASGPVALLNKS